MGPQSSCKLFLDIPASLPVERSSAFASRSAILDLLWLPTAHQHAYKCYLRCYPFYPFFSSFCVAALSSRLRSLAAIPVF